MNTAVNIADLRKDYALKNLDEKDALPDPIAQFSVWMHEALSAKLPEPTAMTLATSLPVAGGGSQPTARIVLLKGFDARGFVFFTNYASRKGAELAANPLAGLLFFWCELEREVRIDGRIEKVDGAESDAYFTSRPLLSRIGAHASPQSRVLRDRAELEASFEAKGKQFGEQVPRPPHWGGYRVVPHEVEFWQGRHSRLHDRLRYRPDGERWVIERLAP
jgi:pyridoxamine 5'-phosphate oxidase